MISRRYFYLLADIALAGDCIPTHRGRTHLRVLSLSSSCVFRQSLKVSRNLARDGRSGRTSYRCFSTTTASSAKSKSSVTWLLRQMKDQKTQRAKVLEYKSRAAFKLLEIDHQFKLLHPGMTVVDLGYAPGSWSQVAVSKTKPQSPGQAQGRVIGVDILPAQPPKGASAIQGNFLAPSVQASIRRYLADSNRGRPHPPQSLSREPEPGPMRLHEITSVAPQTESSDAGSTDIDIDEIWTKGQAKAEAEAEGKKIDTSPILQLDDNASSGYIARERRETQKEVEEETEDVMTQEQKERNTVDVVLSDMCEPLPLTQGYHLSTVLIPWIRLMNTSGVKTQDHALSMRLCNAALSFCIDVLKPGGSFVCKFYAGADDKTLEKRLAVVFEAVHRVKPDSSRSESKEAYFVALRKVRDISKQDIGL